MEVHRTNSLSTLTEFRIYYEISISINIIIIDCERTNFVCLRQSQPKAIINNKYLNRMIVSVLVGGGGRVMDMQPCVFIN